MSTQKGASKKAQSYVNPYETQARSGGPSSIAKDIEQQKQAYEQYIAAQENSGNEPQEAQSPEKQGVINTEFKDVFDLTKHKEDVDRPKRIKEIQTLLQEIRAEIADLKRRSDGLNNEVEQVEKAALSSLPSESGIYHVHYLETMLQFLQGIKEKVGEARTWMQAMQSKKKKRGSAFASRSKKQGTQYSMSQELSAARNVQ